MFKKITSTILILCYLLTSLSVNANPYYEAVHCFDERVDNPQEGDIARCLVGNNNQYMCPINSAACTVESDYETVAPTCKSGLPPVNGVCKESKAGCFWDSNSSVSDTSNAAIVGGEIWSHDGMCLYDRGLNLCYGMTDARHLKSKFWKGKLRARYYFQRFNGNNCGGTTNVSYYPASAQYINTGATPRFESNGRPVNGWCIQNANVPMYSYEICTNIETTEYPTSCPSGFTYNSNKKTCERGTTRDACPLGEQYQCVKSGAASYCSPNTCFDPDAEKEITDDQIDGSMLENNGATDDAGMCLDQVYIFSGRAQKCRPNGVQTAFKDCCATDGKVLKDSSGSSAQTEAYTQSINAVYQASAAAYQAYAAGATAAEAGSAFSSAFVGAFDPTSLAIAVAIAIIMDYLAKACDQIETETAIANSSGRCVDLGEFCKEKWLGKCVQKQRSFCCFNSQLAKIINEQGRLQLKAFQSLPNRGFGDRGNPQCRGFTPEEFQALDFSNIDLTEYYEELIHKSQAEMESTMEQMTAEHFNNVQ